MTTRRKPQSDPPRAALVTGAGKRIGRAIALALARDGWDIAVHYATSRSEALATVASIEALGRRAIAVNRDLAIERGVRSLIGECASELGLPLTCVVNNAAIFEYDSPTRFKAELLVKHVKLNTAAPVMLAQALHAALADDERGVVVNLLDQKLANPNPDFLSYTLSKSALCYATTVLAQALAPKVRVVGVAPGITLPSGTQSEEGFEAAHSRTLLGRSSTPEDIGQAVVYLANASAVTGTTLLVDGGQHLAPSARDVMFITEPE
ncbi:MAG TPA: SDR family oxidoreductase [Burkholderiaceae bacterium]|nr:SDR family oxidoreductase [Burkholderiaceae bacterium]